MAWCSFSKGPINSNYILLPLIIAGAICNIMTEYLMTIWEGFCEQIFSNIWWKLGKDFVSKYFQIFDGNFGRILWANIFKRDRSCSCYLINTEIAENGNKSSFANSRVFRDFLKLVKDRILRGRNSNKIGFLILYTVWNNPSQCNGILWPRLTWSFIMVSTRTELNICI